MRRLFVLIVAVGAVLAGTGIAYADVPVGPANYVPAR